MLGPLQLGLLSSVGLTVLAAHRRPTIAILSTGDEVVAPGQQLRGPQVYDANTATLVAAVREAGGIPLPLGIAPDRVPDLRARLAEAADAHLVITSGGDSHGDFDIVKDLLAAAGQVEFWRVHMRPGRPLGFGTINGRALIGVPGNPGAALVAFEQFIRPAIRKLLGRRQILRPELQVTVRGKAANADGRRCFLRARVELRDGTFVATLAGRGSGSFASLGDANAYVVVPESTPQVNDGDQLTAQILDWPELVAQ